MPRIWIWGALQQLPEPLRVSAMLRYFGSYDSYDEVAAILGVPIGTVRSRLSEVKIRLADALLASAGLIDDEARVRARAREQFWSAAFQDVFRRGASDRFVSHFTRDLLIGWSGGKFARGHEHLAAEIDGDLAVGVRIELERVMTNDGIAHTRRLGSNGRRVFATTRLTSGRGRVCRIGLSHARRAPRRPVGPSGARRRRRVRSTGRVRRARRVRGDRLKGHAFESVSTDEYKKAR